MNAALASALHIPKNAIPAAVMLDLQNFKGPKDCFDQAACKPASVCFLVLFVYCVLSKQLKTFKNSLTNLYVKDLPGGGGYTLCSESMCLHTRSLRNC